MSGPRIVTLLLLLACAAVVGRRGWERAHDTPARLLEQAARPRIVSWALEHGDPRDPAWQRVASLAADDPFTRPVLLLRLADVRELSGPERAWVEHVAATGTDLERALASLALGRALR